MGADSEIPCVPGPGVRGGSVRGLEDGIDIELDAVDVKERV